MVYHGFPSGKRIRHFALDLEQALHVVRRLPKSTANTQVDCEETE